MKHVEKCYNMACMSDMTQLITLVPEAIRRLQSGHVGVLPTDTVYGLVARAEDPIAVQRLYSLKHREQKPGTLIAATTEQLQSLGTPKELLEQVAAYWPGALSAVLPIGEQFSYLHQGVGDIAMRVVANAEVRAILMQTGPLLTSSANHPGAPGAINVLEAWNYFEDTVDFYVDGGDRSGQPPSTIVKPRADGSFQLIRQGGTLVE